MLRVLSLISVLLITVVAHGQQKSAPYQMAKDSANYFMTQKQYDHALAGFKKSFEQGNTNLFDYYNAACAAAVTQKTDDAFVFLNKSIDQGYMDKPWAEKDVDFSSLRRDERWTSAMKKLQDQPKVFAQKFAPIKGKDPASLVPFKQNGLWGYLDKKSLKIVVKPEFRELQFMNGCVEVENVDGTSVWIGPSAEVVEVEYRDRTDYEDMIVIDDSDQQGPFPISSANGFKGFKMNEKKEITHFSDIYNRMSPHFFNINGPFLINGKYYAIAQKGDGAGLIDEEGNSYPGFDFVHDELVFNRHVSGKDAWFYYLEKGSKTRGFINLNGKKKLAGEVLSYPFTSADHFDFSIQDGDKVWGVIDLQKMEWLIKPQKLRLQNVRGTTTAPCKKYTDDRKDMIDVYFRVYEEGATDDEYYIDKKARVYKPK